MECVGMVQWCYLPKARETTTTTTNRRMSKTETDTTSSGNVLVFSSTRDKNKDTLQTRAPLTCAVTYLCSSVVSCPPSGVVLTPTIKADWCYHSEGHYHYHYHPHNVVNDAHCSSNKKKKRKTSTKRTVRNQEGYHSSSSSSNSNSDS